MTDAAEPMLSPAIDVHSHLIPESVMTELSRRSFPSVEVAHDGARRRCFRFAGEDPTPVPPPEIFELGGRARWLAEQRLTHQIVSPWTDLYGYGLQPGEAADWGRFMNDAIAEATSGRDEFSHMAAIPLQDSSRAVAEMQRARRGGCCGVMIGTSTPHRELDDPDLDDVWACAAELQLPIYVHPTRPPGDARGWSAPFANTVGRIREGLLALARLLLAGVPLRHPGLRLVIALGGAGPEALLARLRRHAAVSPAAHDPDAGFRKLYFDSLVLEPERLRELVELVGAERVLLGSDYPFPWEPAPRATVERAGLEAASEAALLSTNARELFGLRLTTSEVVPA